MPSQLAASCWHAGIPASPCTGPQAPVAGVSLCCHQALCTTHAHACSPHALQVLVGKKVRAAMGVRHAIISGGGSLAPSLDEFYEAIGLPVLNGWGLTETSPVLTCRRMLPGQNVRGSVGLPIPGTQVREGSGGAGWGWGPGWPGGGPGRGVKELLVRVHQETSGESKGVGRRRIVPASAARVLSVPHSHCCTPAFTAACPHSLLHTLDQCWALLPWLLRTPAAACGGPGNAGGRGGRAAGFDPGTGPRGHERLLERGASHRQGARLLERMPASP